MIYFKDTYATVWSIENKGNFVQGRISTSEKDTKNQGKWINSNWFCKFSMKCKDLALTLHEKSKIIMSGKVTTYTTGEEGNKKTYTNVTIFDFKVVDNKPTPGNNTFQAETAKGFIKPVETQRTIDGQDGFYPIDTDQLPF